MLKSFTIRFAPVSCSVIQVIIEGPSCTDCSESVQVFKNFNQLSSQSSLYKADEFQVIQALAVVFDF